MIEIACFITPHGFGHASRTIAVLEALQQICRDLHVRLLTSVPEDFFSQTLTSYSYHPVVVDVGLVQTSAFCADIEATVHQLDAFLPFSAPHISNLAKLCADSQLVLCDIAPLGIVVANTLQVPSVLVENFTWDWLYGHYCHSHPQLKRHVNYLKEIYSRTKHRIQTQPLCCPVPQAMGCGTIFRERRGTEAEIRKRLSGSGRQLILVTMGGVAQDLPSLELMNTYPDFTFVFTGQQQTQWVGSNVCLLDRNESFYHPDLIASADVVVCKAGYSTIAECYQAGARVLSVGRTDFAETAFLQRFIKKHLGGLCIDQEQYRQGTWLRLLPNLLLQPQPSPKTHNGAIRVADCLHRLL